MTDAAHPLAPDHMPWFITAPGNTDVLFVVGAISLIVAIMMLGSLYFWLESIPERIAHGTGRIQFAVVGVLSLLGLFTHNSLFWVMALLLALVPVPDFWTPVASMADSLAQMAGRRRALPDPVPEVNSPAEVESLPDDQHQAQR